VSDMPQPLKKWVSDISWQPKDLDKRPELALKIAQVGAAWSQLDLQRVHLLMALLRNGAPTGVRMYLSLSGSASQEAVLTAAFGNFLPDSTQKMFESLMRDIKARARERNRIVHGIWGVSDDYPEALINCQLNDMATNSVTRYRIISHVSTLGLKPIDFEKHQQAEFIKACRVYRANDFKDVFRRIANTTNDIIALLRVVLGDLVELEQRADELNRKQSKPVVSRRDPQKNPSEPG